MANNGWMYQDSDFGALLNNYDNVGTMSQFALSATVNSTEVEIWDKTGAYTYATAAETLYLTSTVAGDNDISVKIHGLKSDFTLASETITTRTTGDARQLGAGGENVTANQYIRIYRMDVLDTTQATGNLHLGSDSTPPATGIPAAADSRAFIAAGENRTLMSMFTVPAGYTGIIVGFGVQIVTSLAAGNSVTIRIRARDASTVATPEVFRNLGVFRYYEGGYAPALSPAVPIARIGEKHDVKVTGKGSVAGNNVVTSHMQILFVPSTKVGAGIANL
jgi:hypothetical protein